MFHKNRPAGWRDRLEAKSGRELHAEAAGPGGERAAGACPRVPAALRLHRCLLEVVVFTKEETLRIMPK